VNKFNEKEKNSKDTKDEDWDFYIEEIGEKMDNHILTVS